MRTNIAGRCILTLIGHVTLATIAAIANGLSPAHAATIIVTNTNDSGAGSLRQALLDSAVGGLVVFHPSLSGTTIRLASTLAIDRGLTIDGSMLGSKVTLNGDSDGNGAGNVRVIDVTAVDLVTVKNLVVTKGYAPTGEGGGIRSLGSMAVIDCTIIDNSAEAGGGIAFRGSGTMSITRSTVAGNVALGPGPGGGGGIYFFGASMTLRDSTVSGNGASSVDPFGNSGGGIYVDGGGLAVVNSSIVANWANGSGGGIYNYGLGATVSALNTTIAYNAADLDDDQDGVAAGVRAGGGFTMRSSLIAGNYVRNLPIYDDCEGTVTSNGINIIKALSTNISGSCTIVGNWTPLNSLALLGGLQDNGGPTQTVALLPGTNAIDGDNSLFTCLDFLANPVTTDQRGVLRPKGLICDIGAFEYSPEADTDGDGVDDALDNCTARANSTQCDSDGDGYGNRCDGDLNNNAATNAQDTTLFRQQLAQPSVAPPYNPADLNCNGAVNAQDTSLFRQLLGSPPGPSALVP